MVPQVSKVGVLQQVTLRLARAGGVYVHLRASFRPAAKRLGDVLEQAGAQLPGTVAFPPNQALEGLEGANFAVLGHTPGAPGSYLVDYLRNEVSGLESK